MAELQTIDEMRAAYDGDWVLIVDCEHDEAGWVVRGRVAAHSPKRADIYRQMSKYRTSAIRYLGKIPDDLIYAL